MGTQQRAFKVCACFKGSLKFVFNPVILTSWIQNRNRLFASVVWFDFRAHATAARLCGFVSWDLQKLKADTWKTGTIDCPKDDQPG